MATSGNGIRQTSDILYYVCMINLLPVTARGETGTRWFPARLPAPFNSQQRLHAFPGSRTDRIQSRLRHEITHEVKEKGYWNRCISLAQILIVPIVNCADIFRQFRRHQNTMFSQFFTASVHWRIFQANVPSKLVKFAV